MNGPIKQAGTNQPISKHSRSNSGLPDFAAMMRDPIVLGLGDTQPQQHADHRHHKHHETRSHNTLGSGVGNKLPGVIALSPGDHIDLLGEHKNPHLKAAIHTTDGTHVPIGPNLGKAKVNLPTGHIDKLPGVIALPPGHHIDGVGEHNNPHNEPVIHTDAGHHVKIQPDIGHPLNTDPHGHLDKLPGVVSTKGDHIDYPGQHENTHKGPVLHKADGTHLHLKTDHGHPHDAGPHGTIDKLPGVIALPPGHHIDGVGEHNNPHNEPAVHTDAGHHVKIQPDIGHPLNTDPHGHLDKLPGVVSTKGDHIDYPGQHENTHKGPVLHKADGTHLHLKTDHGHPHDTGSHGTIDKLPGVIALPAGHHIDLLGEHKNPHNGPAIHTDTGHHIKIKPGIGHPLNTDPHGHLDKLPGVVSTKGDHIDYPGQHENTHKGPVLHKADGTHLHLKTDHGHPHDTGPHGTIDKLPGVIALPAGHHIDLLGEHKNPHNGPAIHTNTGHHIKIKPDIGHPPNADPHGHLDKLPGVVSTKGDHIDYPGQHENTHKGPVLHKADGTHLHLKTDHGHPHDTGSHGTIDKLPGVIALPAGHHIDLLGEHKNPHNGPAIHTNTGHHIKIKPDIGHPPNADPHGHLDKLPGVVSTKGDHIDYPGQHESTHKGPVLHKADGTHLHLKTDHGHPHGTVPHGTIDKLPGVVKPDIGSSPSHHPKKIKPELGHPSNQFPHGHVDKHHLPFIPGSNEPGVPPPDELPNLFGQPNKAPKTVIGIPNYLPRLDKLGEHKPVSKIKSKPDKPIIPPIDNVPDLSGQHHVPKTVVAMPDYLPRFDKVNKPKPIIPPADELPNLFDHPNTAPKPIAGIPDYLPRLDKVSEPLSSIKRTVQKTLKTANGKQRRKQNLKSTNRRGNFRKPKRQRINKFRDMHSLPPNDNLQSTIIKEVSKETAGGLPPLRKPFRRFNKPSRETSDELPPLRKPLRRLNRFNRFRNLRRGRFQNDDRRRAGRGRWRNRRRFRGRGRNLRRILRRLRRD